MKSTSQQLEEAFASFGKVSSQLARAYRDLQIQVAVLNDQLEASQRDRQRQQAEKERLADRLSSLLSELPGGVLVLDAQERIAEFNPGASELLGEPLAGMPWREVAKRCFVIAVDSGEAQLRNGRRIAIGRRALSSEPAHILLLTDTTQTHELQKRLARSRRLSEMGEMTARLAHQIRTPLTSAMLYASQLRRSSPNAEATTRFAERILSHLNHLERTVSDMLTFSKGGDIDFAEISLQGLLDMTVQALLPLAPGAQIRSRNEAYVHSIHGNRDALSGALLNLGNNAIEATGKDAVVSIIARQPDDGHVDLVVSDNGPGVPAAIRSRIFEPFFTTRGNGTGLGLAVVRSVAQSHGGAVWVDSEEGNGSTFVLRVPLIPMIHCETSNHPRNDHMSSELDALPVGD